MVYEPTLNDLKSTREFLESVNEYLKNYKDIDKDFVCGYVPYGFSELGGYANCMQKYSESIKAYNENAEKYNRANELINEICIEEYEESRKENAKANIIRNGFKYGLVAVFGIMTIATAGGTFGLSIACGSTLLTETFCAYDIAENIDEYSLAMIGNTKDVAENDLRDIYFKGNKNAYNCARNIIDTIFFLQSFVNMTEAGIKEGTSIAGRARAYGKSLKNATIYGIGTTVGSDLTIESMEAIAGQELTPSQRAWVEGSIEMGFTAYALGNLKVQRTDKLSVTSEKMMPKVEGEIKAPEMPKNVNQHAENPVKNVLEGENPNIKAKEAPRHRKLSESSAYQSGTPSSKSGNYSSLRDLMSPEEAARYDEHWLDVAEKISNETLDNNIAFIKNGGITRQNGKIYEPSKVCCAVDLNTGETYIGYSGKRGMNPSKPVNGQLESELQIRVDRTKEIAKNTIGNPYADRSSFYTYPVDNCAEVFATNNALLGGADIDNIFLNTRNFWSEEYAPLCDNCKITFENFKLPKNK